jgi:hypothetical protein
MAKFQFLGLSALALLLVNGVQALSCENAVDDHAIFTAPTGAQFEVFCFEDFYRGDLAAVDSATFDDCITACADTTGCLAVAYVYGRCYMKNRLGDEPQHADWVWGAKLVNATALTCVNNEDDNTVYTSSAGNEYEIRCGIDYYGGDFAECHVESFQYCVEECDKETQCVDVVYNHGTCFLKSVLTQPTELSYVWNARLLGQASSSPVPTTTVTPESTTSAPEVTTSAAPEVTTTAAPEITTSTAQIAPETST